MKGIINKKILSAFVFIALGTTNSYAEVCKSSILRNWDKTKLNSSFQCAYANDKKGAFILYKSQGLGLEVGFFKMKNGQIETTPLIKSLGEGYQILDFNYNKKKIKSLYADLNNDGKKEFVFRTTSEYGAVLRVLYFDSETDQAFKAHNFVFKGGDTNTQFNLLSHSGSHPLNIKSSQIKAVVENINNGSTQSFRVIYNWDAPSKNFVSKEMSPL